LKSTVIAKNLVTVSIGIAQPSAAVTVPEEVIRAADKALYRAKEGGRDRVEVYDARRLNAASSSQSAHGCCWSGTMNAVPLRSHD
jgi:predicted signal transduction protein with EAL and GGDEF domain